MSKAQLFLCAPNKHTKEVREIICLQSGEPRQPWELYRFWVPKPRSQVVGPIYCLFIGFVLADADPSNFVWQSITQNCNCKSATAETWVSAPSPMRKQMASFCCKKQSLCPGEHLVKRKTQSHCSANIIRLKRLTNFGRRERKTQNRNSTSETSVRQLMMPMANKISHLFEWAGPPAAPSKPEENGLSGIPWQVPSMQLAKIYVEVRVQSLKQGIQKESARFTP